MPDYIIGNGGLQLNWRFTAREKAMVRLVLFIYLFTGTLQPLEFESRHSSPASSTDCALTTLGQTGSALTGRQPNRARSAVSSNAKGSWDHLGVRTPLPV